MIKYFDKDFFKFLMGFLAIVSLSLLIIVVTRHYAEVQAQMASVIGATNSLNVN